MPRISRIIACSSREMVRSARCWMACRMSEAVLMMMRLLWIEMEWAPAAERKAVDAGRRGAAVKVRSRGAPNGVGVRWAWRAAGGEPRRAGVPSTWQNSRQRNTAPTSGRRNQRHRRMPDFGRGTYRVRASTRRRFSSAAPARLDFKASTGDGLKAERTRRPQEAEVVSDAEARIGRRTRSWRSLACPKRCRWGRYR